MNGFASEGSSGCESGWTMYLDQSSVRVDSCKRGDGFVQGGGDFGEFFKGKEAKEEDEEEDMSMVSDASSGPPHFHEDEVYCDENGRLCSASSASALVKKSSKRQKMEEHQRREDQHQHTSFLDDTASSTVLTFSKNNLALSSNQTSMDNVLDFSQGYSVTHVKKHFLFLKSPLPGKPKSAKPVGCREKDRNEIW